MPILLNIHEKWMSYATPLKSSLTSWNPCLVSPETTCSCSTDKHQTKSMSKTKGQLQQKTLQTPFLAFLCLSFDRITDSVTEATKGLTKTSDSSKFWDSIAPDTAQILPSCWSLSSAMGPPLAFAIWVADGWLWRMWSSHPMPSHERTAFFWGQSFRSDRGFLSNYGRS